MCTACVVQHRHAKAKMRALRQRQADAAHAEDADGFMMHVNAVPVRPDAALPFPCLDPLGHLDHPACGGQYQAHDGIGHGFGQDGWGMHQQHPVGVERCNVKVVITDGYGGRRTQFGGALQKGFVNLAAGTEDAFGLL